MTEFREGKAKSLDEFLDINLRHRVANMPAIPIFSDSYDKLLTLKSQYDDVVVVCTKACMPVADQPTTPAMRQGVVMRKEDNLVLGKIITSPEQDLVFNETRETHHYDSPYEEKPHSIDGVPIRYYGLNGLSCAYRPFHA